MFGQRSTEWVKNVKDNGLRLLPFRRRDLFDNGFGASLQTLQNGSSSVVFLVTSGVPQNTNTTLGNKSGWNRPLANEATARSSPTGASTSTGLGVGLTWLAVPSLLSFCGWRPELLEAGVEERPREMLTQATLC